MQTLTFEYEAATSAAKRAQSAWWEVVISRSCSSPPTISKASVRVRTTVDGFDVVWRTVLDAFFRHHPVAGRYELNDFGANAGDRRPSAAASPQEERHMSNPDATTTAVAMDERPALWIVKASWSSHARARAHVLLDEGTGRELCGPFDRVESPWLEPQGLVPQADDGLVVVKGMLAGEPCVVIAIEQAFQGGGIGEVSGAKAACALQLAARDARAGQAISAVLLLETGGVRLQEATLGLNAVAEVLSAILELRRLRPVVGVAAGPLGSFGGMSIGAGLCTRMVLTHEGRLGLNGPEVIESEAGVAEFDASDRALVWSVDGGAQRYATGLADALVLDDVSAVRHAVITAVAAGVPELHRSQQLDVLEGLLSRDDLASLQPEDLQAGGRERFSLPDLGIAPAPSPGAGALTASELGSKQHRGAVS